MWKLIAYSIYTIMYKVAKYGNIIPKEIGVFTLHKIMVEYVN